MELDNNQISLALFFGSIIAGLLGSITGLGGGFIIVPLLTTLFGVEAHYAVGTSLIAIIANSSGASVAYMEKGFSNIRVGLLLETSATLGAILGVFAAASISGNHLIGIFGIVMLVSAFLSYLPPVDRPISGKNPDWAANFFSLDAWFPSLEGRRYYQVRNVGSGYVTVFGAGILSGMLGIGAGAFNVLAMDRIMRLPFKVSLTTSNFMIGVTAAASAGIYLRMGYIDPALTMPVVLGVIVGAYAGAKILPKTHTKVLRNIFVGILLLVAIKMIYTAQIGFVEIKKTPSGAEKHG